MRLVQAIPINSSRKLCRTKSSKAFSLPYHAQIAFWINSLSKSLRHWASLTAKVCKDAIMWCLSLITLRSKWIIMKTGNKPPRYATKSYSLMVTPSPKTDETKITSEIAEAMWEPTTMMSNPVSTKTGERVTFPAGFAAWYAASSNTPQLAAKESTQQKAIKPNWSCHKSYKTNVYTTRQVSIPHIPYSTHVGYNF